MELSFSNSPRLLIHTCTKKKWYVMKCSSRGPTGEPPNYRATIDRLPQNRFFMGRFQQALDAQLALSLPGDKSISTAASTSGGFDRVIGAVLTLADIHSDDAALQSSSLQVLRSLLPTWLPGVFYAVFVRASTDLAAAMCAYVTVFATQWLMGTSSICDDDEDGNNNNYSNVVKIERCRYLEESKCMGICLNSCKIPTEQFFREDMRMDLHVEPNFDDYSCKFKFGVAPPNAKDDPAFKEPCFVNCPLPSRKSNQRLCSDP